MRQRKSFLVTSLALAAVVLAGVGYWANQSQARTSVEGPNYLSSDHPGKLIVHEWGTFTSFSGSNGVRIDFRPLADNDLPAFVINRARQAGAWHPLAKFNLLVQERMETPVTYFYTDREREVNVKVGFPQGLLTEFYPPVQQMLPKFEWKNAVKIRDSELDWGTVQLIPESKLGNTVADKGLSEVIRQRLLGSLLPDTQGNHYQFARETDSALVHVNLPGKKDLYSVPNGDFFEKFLFYRGIGNFELPIHVVAKGSGRFEVSNSGSDAIRSLFLVTADGKELRFAKAEQIDPQGKLTMVQSSTKANLDDLAEAVVESLVAEKLYEKEARSMVNTWRQSWFGEQGTRLFYVVPSRLTEALLPLTISPAPDEMVRVLVGRFEIMSPEDEARVTKLVQQSIVARDEHLKKAEKDEKLRQQGLPLPESIRNLGRLAEPALVRVRTIAKEPAVREEAGRLLAQWSQQRGLE